MTVELILEPDDEGPTLRMATHCSMTLLRDATGGGLPGVLIQIPGEEVVLMLTLREFLTAARGLRAKAEGWPEWQQADTP